MLGPQRLALAQLTQAPPPCPTNGLLHRPRPRLPFRSADLPISLNQLLDELSATHHRARCKVPHLSKQNLRHNHAIIVINGKNGKQQTNDRKALARSGHPSWQAGRGDGRIMISKRLPEAERRWLGVDPNMRLRKPNEAGAEFLAYHRTLFN